MRASPRPAGVRRRIVEFVARLLHVQVKFDACWCDVKYADHLASAAAPNFILQVQQQPAPIFSNGNVESAFANMGIAQIASAKHNAFVNDLLIGMNTPRPIQSGGTGRPDPEAA
ncbi:hypothetical protein P7F60_12010 [Rhizobium sp. YJ-22]|uniref:hypothetical protein n=1 Tax=Rhizobium sp. YJ-22 TaxID=3037556 RepID=UPI002412D34D|nr:hypothetical protein [Rhizobium sp. YJ-22]MDG3577117.1 hypothetical protein [Rhizobium sp. YJ-22]